MLHHIKAALFGMAVGDALGVPVEFKSREYLKVNPVSGISGYGSWNQPPGTWSDDSSLAFCLAESLAKGYDLKDIARNFIHWKDNGFWGAHHKLFDIGGATRCAIDRLKAGASPTASGGMMEDDNGNGSLMRIMPLLFLINEMPPEEQYEKVKEVSSITHMHFRSVFSCFIYLQIAGLILGGDSVSSAYHKAKQLVNNFAEEKQFSQNEIKLFSRILKKDISKEPEFSIHSGGYVLHTLEASLWCLLNTNSYEEAVLKAVNLGDDTDTTACVTGGIAGILYGYKSIPEQWINEIARKNDIDDLCQRLFLKINQ